MKPRISTPWVARPPFGGIVLSARGVACAFGLAVAWLVLAHLAVQTVRFATGNDRLSGLVFFFSLGADGNLPSFYSSVAILFCAVLLAAIAWQHRSDETVPYWWLLAVVFALLALDEALELHEKLIKPLQSLLNTGGLFHYAWVIPYGLATLVFGGLYLRFLLGLPRRTAVLFVVSGAIYVAGAIGLEMVGGLLVENGGTRTIEYVAAQTLEEVLEMSGIVLFIYALVNYLEYELGGLDIRLGADPFAAPGQRVPRSARARPRLAAALRPER